MQYLLSDRAYGVLKWVGLIALPAVAVFCGTVLPVWGVDGTLTDAIVTTLNAAGVLVGALIAASAGMGAQASGADDGEADEASEVDYTPQGDGEPDASD